ncbi:hypothetical protein BDFB_006373 [Asbolus verrucosus]|uniref:Uncharacterized protein n=1 Tax=Asbolus verrucosus TaxID=1661398 RepID=A0A482VMM0_ASBVE|nr:hypothetical protein BDFB_006373 [Asbolus verrucosus]
MGRAPSGQALCSWVKKPPHHSGGCARLGLSACRRTTGAWPSKSARGFAASCRPGSCHTHNYIAADAVEVSWEPRASDASSAGGACSTRRFRLDLKNSKLSSGKTKIRCYADCGWFYLADL